LIAPTAARGPETKIMCPKPAGTCRTTAPGQRRQAGDAADVSGPGPRQAATRHRSRLRKSLSAAVAASRSAGSVQLFGQKPFGGCTGAVESVAMVSRISHTSFDAADAYAQSVFWSQVLDFVEDPDDPNKPGHAECLITSRDGSQLLVFITVPDGKQLKNRMHLDLRPVDGAREREVERVLALGASQIADHRRPDGSGWITLADPEGNEFCVLSQHPAGSGAST
jgi:predicted enzyme related to lactoylglutathione lyase